ncbi:MAG: LTA synthase family protein, partial [Lachnospiraceae bacterium]|nr:LTA synthase family protein [Lachnospiraceae bacterium]
MKANNENEIKIIDMDAMETGALPFIEDSALSETPQADTNEEDIVSDIPEEISYTPDTSADETISVSPGRITAWPSRFGNNHILVYFILFFVTILYYEFLLRIDISGSFTRANLPLLAFVPAQALFCASLCGWFKDHPRINGILASLVVFGLGFYYFAQLIYYRLSGSLLSVSLMNMGGEAMGNFGWTIKDILIGSIPHLILMCIPFIATIVLSFIHLPSEKEGQPAPLPGGAYRIWLHPLCMAAAFGLWTIGGVALALGGRDRDSAYYVFKDALSDTDSSSIRLGTLTTTLVEASAYYLGTDNEASSPITTVDMAAIDLGKKSAPAPSADILATGKENALSANEAVVSENVIDIHPWANEDIDFTALKEMTNDATTAALCDYFASRVPTESNEYTGLFEGHNLIYICAEAFSGYGIDKDITPTLYKMANNGIVLENFYNSFPNTTTNGEYALSTSLWPDVSRFAMAGTAVGSFPQSANVFMPYGLGDLFDSVEDVESYAYHNYYGDYYKRCYSWPNLGYQHMKFLGQGMVFTSSWPASDLEMIEQSMDDYIRRERFLAYYMTFSGHGPYNASNFMYRKNIDAVKERAAGKYKSDEVLGYFCGEYELELAMETLLNRLEEEGQLENTVIVLAGDHYPYYLSDPAVTEINGGVLPDTFEKSHSTCIIYNAGIKEPIKCDTYCCNVDILPTVLNLFNIDFDSRMYMGTDVFSDGIHRARLYNGSFITEYVSYDKSTGKKTWSPAADDFSEKELDAYYEAMLDYTSSEYSAALNLIKSNFYYFAWKNAGLL